MKRYPFIGNVNGVQVGKQIEMKNLVLFLKTKTAGVANDSQTPCDVWTLMKFGEGTLSWTSAIELNYMRNRTKLDDITSGDDQPLDISFDGKATFVTSQSSEPATIFEIVRGKDLATQTMKFQGTAESWLSSYGCPPYACELEAHMIPQLECPLLEVFGEAHLFRYFRSTSFEWNPDNGRVSCRGTAHVLDPFVIRPDFYTLYQTELQTGKLLEADLKPLQDIAGGEDLWLPDSREA